MPKGGTFNWAATVPVGGPYTTVPCASVPFGLPTRRNAPVPRSPTGKPNAVPSVSDDGGTAMISFFCVSAVQVGDDHNVVCRDGTTRVADNQHRYQCNCPRDEPICLRIVHVILLRSIN